MSANKIAIINDTHFGVKNGNDVFFNYQEKFFRDIFFPYCKKHGITKIIHMGDLYEHRKYINIKILSQLRLRFFEKIRENGMTMDIIPGNHDCFYKNTNTLCSLIESLQPYSDCINIYMEPQQIDYYGLKVSLLPWMSKDNTQQCIDFIKNDTSRILCSHLELKGFEMMKGGGVVSHGLNTDLFNNYDKVLSGHYHTKSQKGNVFYFGTQYELTWSDYNDPKFFHILNTKTQEIKAIRNPNLLFHKIYYDNNPSQVLPDIENAFVKLIITNKGNLKVLDNFVDKIQSHSPFELKIIDSLEEFLGESIDDESVLMTDTPTLLNSYVDAINTSLDKNTIKMDLQNLYLEALNSEII